MSNLNWLFVSFTSLTWWQMMLWGIYFIYFLVRSWHFWQETYNKSIVKAYKEVIFEYERYFRVYHIIKIIFDIPPAIIGLSFPILRRILTYKIYEFKKEKTEHHG